MSTLVLLDGLRRPGDATMRHLVSECRLGGRPDGEPDVVVEFVVQDHDEALQVAAERVVALRGSWSLDDQGRLVARGQDGCHYHWDVNPIP